MPAQTKSTTKKTTPDTSLVVTAVGRRKRAVARVRLTFKKGDWVVNQRPASKYFGSPLYQSLLALPLVKAGVQDRVKVEAKIVGGGLMAQLEALNHALARALVAYDETKYKKLMRRFGFLTRDPREKERRKPGRGGKARRKRQSPKR